MSTTYNVQSGDTYASVARKVYGDDTQSGRISAANPGVFEPLQPGTVLSVPDQPGAPRDVPHAAPAASVDEVSLFIDGARFRFWTDVEVVRSIDTFDIVSVSAPFEPDNLDFRSAFQPLTYKPLDVDVGTESLFVGTMVAVAPRLFIGGNTVSASGYSLPGVLGDCSPPASAHPLEFNNQDLRQISETVCTPYGLAVVFDGAPGPKFSRVAMDPAASVLEFLIKLAKQRGLIVSNNPEGALLYRSAVADGVPVATLRQGESPCIGVTPQINAQEFYSSITGIQPATTGRGGAQYTTQNPLLRGVVRPHTFTVDDSEGGSVKTAVDAKLSRTLANAVTYTVEVSTWRDPLGSLWAPNTLISLEAPRAMVYNPYVFLVKKVTLTASGDSQTASLDLVMAGAYSGTLPRVFPWG